MVVCIWWRSRSGGGRGHGCGDGGTDVRCTTTTKPASRIRAFRLTVITRLRSFTRARACALSYDDNNNYDNSVHVVLVMVKFVSIRFNGRTDIKNIVPVLRR